MSCQNFQNNPEYAAHHFKCFLFGHYNNCASEDYSKLIKSFLFSVPIIVDNQVNG